MKKITVLCLILALLAPAAALGEVDARVERALTALTSADAAALDALYAEFTAQMQAAAPREALDTMMAQIEAAAGDFVGASGDTTQTEQGGYTLLAQHLSMAGATDMTFTLVLDGEGKIAGLSIQPAAKPQTASEMALPEGVVESEVTVGEGEWALPGTLTMPANAENCPAVVLVHGSGPNDRDETVGANKPFRDIAWALAGQGIAVLRYEKRTLEHGARLAQDEALLREFTVQEETIDDAVAAGRLLARTAGVDESRVFVAGHSLGAMLAPRIVQAGEGVFCGMALLCGTPLQLKDIMIRQNETAIDALEGETRAQYEAMLFEQLDALDRALAGTAQDAKNETVFGQSAYYFYEMAQYDTAQIMRSLAVPTLIVNGSADFQINEAEGRLAWAAALDLTAPWLTTLFTGCNHLLMTVDAPEGVRGTTAEYNIAAAVDGEILDALAAFILNH